MNAKIHRTNTKMFSRAAKGSYKLFVTLIAMVAIIGSQILLISVKTTNAQDKQRIEAAKSQIRSAAMQYERAIGQVRMLSSQSLKTRQEVERAISTLQQIRPALDKGPFPNLVNTALNNSTFKRAVEEEAKRVGHERLYQELKRNPSMVLNFTGARQLQSAMKSELRQQAEYFRTLGNKLKAAKEMFERDQRNSSRDLLVPSINNPYITAFASYKSPVFDTAPTESKFSAVTIIEAGYINATEPVSFAAFLPGAIETALIAAAVVIIGAAAAAAAVLIKAYVDVKVEDFTDPVDGSGVSDYKKCTDEADAKLDSCLDGINSNLPWWEKLARESACWSVYTLRKTDCLLLPQ